MVKSGNGLVYSLHSLSVRHLGSIGPLGLLVRSTRHAEFADGISAPLGTLSCTFEGNIGYKVVIHARLL